MKTLFKKIRESMTAAKKKAEYAEIEEEEEKESQMEEGPEKNEPVFMNISPAEPGEFQTIKIMVKGQGEQTLLPDDCQFGDNELCYAEA
jgi:hypothetical protein